MDSTAPAQLKPCPNPWCHRSEGLPPALTWTGAEAYVECTSCGLQGPWVSAVIHDEDGEFVGTRDAEAEAIAAWNQRPAQDSTQEAESELVERLRVKARQASDVSRQLAEAKSLRQSDNHERLTDLYMWTKPEDTVEWRAADRITRLEAALREAEARNAKLDAECERAWSAYRIAHDQAMKNGEAAILARTALGGVGQ